MSHAGGPNYDILVTMANQISQFFDSQGPGAEAGIAEHIRKFWDPRMRSRIVEYTRGGGQGLRESAVRAVGLMARPDHRA